MTITLILEPLAAWAMEEGIKIQLMYVDAHVGNVLQKLLPIGIDARGKYSDLWGTNTN